MFNGGYILAINPLQREGRVFVAMTTDTIATAMMAATCLENDDEYEVVYQEDDLGDDFDSARMRVMMILMSRDHRFGHFVRCLHEYVTYS